LKALLAAAASCALLSTPVRGLADTTVTHVGNVELIESQPDATPNPHLAFQHATTAVRRNIGGTLRGADTLIRTALSFLGTRYIFGGTSPSGFDCSGFTYYAFARIGIHIPRTADAQFASGLPIAGDPLPGDLVFFQTYDYGASHVGIYLGNGEFVNAIGSDVHVASFASPYFRSRYLGARRFLPT
jgi:cell wall-associated NlpC family hydrolase